MRYRIGVGMNNRIQQQGSLIVEFALLLPIFLLMIMFYLYSALLMWDGFSSQWFLWRATRLESTTILSPSQLINTLTTNQLGQNIGFLNSLVSTSELTISLINALGENVAVPSHFSASSNQYYCQNNMLSSCITSLQLQLCQTGSTPCQSPSWLFSDFSLHFSMPLNGLSFTRPIEAAGGFY